MPPTYHDITRLRNLTDHDVNIVDRDGNIVVIPPEGGKVPRVDESRNGRWNLLTEQGVFTAVFVERGKVRDLPPLEPGVGLIVSTLVLEKLTHERPDLLSPGKPIRDKDGKVIAAEGFAITEAWASQIPF